MTKRIAYTTETGGVGVIVPAPDSGLTLAEVAAKDVPQGVEFSIIEASDLPTDRTFRAAWEKTGTGIVESLDKSKQIAHGRRRAKRAAEMAPHDLEATIPAKAAAAEAARQAIRDKHAEIQIRIYAAVSVAELRTELAALL